eukprot:gene3526-4661_t
MPYGIDSKFEPKRQMVESETVSADGLTWTFKLRDGVKWHDGKPFTSADVKYTWEAVKDEKFIAESKDGSSEVESIDTPDDLTVVVNYNTILPTFASTLFTFGIFPKHALEGTDLNTSSYNQTPIGTGPFKFVEMKQNESIKLARNPDYWKPGRPYLDAIEFSIIPNRATSLLTFVAGKLDMTFTSVVTPAMVNDLKVQAPTAICEAQPTNTQANLLVNRE